MHFSDLSGKEFIEVLSSNAPVPGGGGAASYVGAIGIALGNMVGSLTVGKKKYADVEADIIKLKEKADLLQKEFLTLIDKDAEVFEPLSKAYRLPKDTEEEKAARAEVMEKALKTACSVPLEIMKKCCEALELVKEFAQKGSALAISDAGCGAACLKAALVSASLNVFINTNLMTDRDLAEEANSKANSMLEEYGKLADEIFNQVRARL
jgi:formiminotetrahydrofolate cyclodeaminase